MIKAACLSIILVLTPVSAWACIPLPAGSSKPDVTELAVDMIENSGGYFVGKVEATEIQPPIENGDYIVTYKVLKQYAGTPVSEIAVPMKGRNCKSYDPVVGKIEIITPVLVPTVDAPLFYHANPDGITNEELETALNKYFETETSK